MKIELSESIGYYLVFKNNKILIDFNQYQKFNNDDYLWHENNEISEYPYYNKTPNIKENLLEYFYTKLYIIKHINNDIYDLRTENCEKLLINFKYDEYIRKKYNVIDYIPGHNRTNSKNILYNMTWIIIEENKNDLLNWIDAPTYYMMYCEPNTLVKLIKEEYDQLMEYNKSINYTLTWFHHIRIHSNNNYNYIIAKFNKSIIQINTIIPTFNKNDNIIQIFESTNVNLPQEYDLFKKIDKEVRKNNNVISVIKGHFKSKGMMANIERNRIWILPTHYLMICEKNTLVKLCEGSYKKILNFEKNNNYGTKITWYKLKNGYIGTTLESKKQLYMHQVIMDYYGNGMGTGNKTNDMEHLSVDHIDQDPTNNMLSNLRLATREEQEMNSKGIKPDTKRNRKHNAKPLPDGLTHDMMPKYVVYYSECYNKDNNLFREFFKIEKHPKLDKIWVSSKSNKMPLLEKLESAKSMINSLS